MVITSMTYSTFTVNVDSLACRDEAIPVENHEGVQTSLLDKDDTSFICATNGVTYTSLCRLIQDTGNEAVAYAGQCGREECQGGPVSVDISIGIYFDQ